MTLEIDQHLQTDRPSPAHETAIYFFIAEAITNATRHGNAQPVRVSVRHDQAALHATVSDDGPGGARLVAGGGLAGLTDRIEALGGHLTIHSDPCPDHPLNHGSTLIATLPSGPTSR